MGPRFLSFASTVDAFATGVGILVAIISAEVNAPAPDAGSSQTSQTQEQAPLSSDGRGGDRFTTDIDAPNNEVQVNVDRQ